MMKFQPISIFLSILLVSRLIFACNDSKPPAVMPATPVANNDSVKKFTAAMVDNKKDPSCGMPVTAGIKDTVHFNGKVYGFCSDECKQAFLKNPALLAKNAELK